MPEFPEVNVVIKKLELRTLNKTIKSVDVLREQTIEGDVEHFKKTLEGATISSFEQVGKFIVFHLSNKQVIISHLRMEGKYFFKEEKAPLGKHDLVVFHFTDDTKLVYNDTRRFGRMSVESESTYRDVPPLCNVGPNPFEMKDASLLEKAFKNKSIAIKTALLDQSIMSGLGNIYTDEVLFIANTHPETPAKLVSRQKLEEILITSQEVLKEAMLAGGSTIHSFSSDGIAGDFQVKLQVYGKKDGTCPRCGAKLRKIFVNGRGTTYCPKCQKNPEIPVVFGVTGPIGAGKTTVSKLIAKHGFKLLDCDEIVHELYKKESIQNAIRKLIPELKITDNDIDRSWLKSFLIANPKKKKQLEKLVHALVVEDVEKEIKHSKQPVLIEAAFLFETELYQLCDVTIFVDALKDKQIEHLKSRGDDVEKALKLNANFNYENKEKATVIIINDNDVASLDKQISSIFDK